MGEVLTADTVPLEALTNPPEYRLYLRNVTTDLPTHQLIDIARYVVGGELPDRVTHHPIVTHHPVKWGAETVSVPAVNHGVASAMIDFLFNVEDR
jgi:hypothetical protein